MPELTEWERIPGADDAFQRFVCDTPPIGVSFQVLEQDWEERDGLWYRTVHKVRILGSGPDD
jgi:hypothetical protein